MTIVPASAAALRAGSGAAIGGAAVLSVATWLHPSGADPSDPAAAFAEYAADRLWVASHLGQFAGLILAVAGLAVLARTLASGPRGWAAQWGLALALAALAVGAALQAVDGVALKLMVDRWAAASGAMRASVFEAALAVRQIEIGLAAFLGILFGCAGLLFGVALTSGAVYPAWSGWLALAGGAGTLAGGIITAFSGFSGLAMDVGMTGNIAMTAWIVAIGVLMGRAARAGLWP